MTETNTFEEQLKERVQVKNIPNAEFTAATFSFADYFDLDTVERLDGIDDFINYVFEPYRAYFDGVEEIDYTLNSEPNMRWFVVDIAIPDDQDRQRLLANIVADAWEQRAQR